MGIAMQNHVDAFRVFPTGGAVPNPSIGDYCSGTLNAPGTPNGTNKQGLGAFYQILPFLEQNAVKGITTQTQLQSTIIPLYNCPSRRPAVKAGNASTGGQLTDYGTAQPASPDPTGYCGTNAYVPLDAWPFTGPSPGFAIRSYWCGDSPASAGSWGTDPDHNALYGGVIVRTPYRIITPASASTPAKGEIVPGFPTAVKPSQISDGLSSTLIISEKVVRSDLYEGQAAPDPGGGGVSDDKGWADGWDPDSVRFTGVPPISDDDTGVCRNPNSAIQRTCIGFEGQIPVLFFGSAHTSGVNACYADASVHFINFDVDHRVFNSLGTRAGEETLDTSKL
jgi:hypothetical protein